MHDIYGYYFTWRFNTDQPFPNDERSLKWSCCQCLPLHTKVPIREKWICPGVMVTSSRRSFSNSNHSPRYCAGKWHSGVLDGARSTNVQENHTMYYLYICIYIYSIWIKTNCTSSYILIKTQTLPAILLLLLLYSYNKISTVIPMH